MTNKRSFHLVTKKSDLPHGLTELNAFDSADRGFLSHSDWFGHVARYGHALKVVEKTKPDRIIDVGCGSLNLAKFLWRNRSSFLGTYVGLDLRASEKWFEGITWDQDMELYRYDLVEDDVNIIDPAPLVVCFETFEHVPRDYQMHLLERLYHWTKPGGLCLFSTPNAGVARSTAQNHIGPEGDRERTYEEKLEMCSQAGFNVENTWGVFCGSSRLPKDFLNTPVMKAAKEFYMDSMFVTFAAALYPALSNNALFSMRRLS